MGWVEPIEPLLVPAAALPVVQQHQQHRRHPEPLVVVGEHLRPDKAILSASHPKGQHKITQENEHGPCRQLYAAMPPQGIQQHTAQQKTPAAICDGCPHGQRAGDDKGHHRRGNGHFLHLGEKHQKYDHRKWPTQNGGNGSNAFCKLFLPQPVDALPDDAQQHQILKNRVQRVEAIEKVVKANIDYVPPYGSGATLYIRPYMFGSNPVIGVKPANEYQFRVFVTPVGPYFKGGVKPITIRVSDFDRAAPHGTGHIKAGLNYAMSLHAIVDAHNQGFDENMYLDAATRTKVEETGGANFIFVTKDNKIVTPKSNSILPSITRRSLMYVAKEYLGLEVEEREVYFDEVKDFTECGLCGTAAVISPVGKINDHGKEICFPSGMDEIGPVLKKLYETLTGIQMGTIEAPEGWIKVIEE